MMKNILVLILGLILGVLGTLWFQRIQADISKQVSGQVEPVLNAHIQVAEFAANKGRIPKDISELEAFSRNDPNSRFDPQKFSELRFEELSNKTARIIWRLSSPYTNVFGTNTLSWEKTNTR